MVQYYSHKPEQLLKKRESGELRVQAISYHTVWSMQSNHIAVSCHMTHNIKNGDRKLGHLFATRGAVKNALTILLGEHVQVFQEYII